MVLDEGPTVALCSAQRVFTLKRTAILRIEMLKQVQMTPRKGFRLQDRGLVNRTGLPIQGFAANEVVIQTAVLGSPSNCHPNLFRDLGVDLTIKLSTLPFLIAFPTNQIYTYAFFEAYSPGSPLLCRLSFLQVDKPVDCTDKESASYDVSKSHRY